YFKMAEEKDLLLADIKTQVGEELNKRGFQKKEDVDSLITEKMKAFEGLNLDALRTITTQDGGVLEILEKQGKEINALKERNTPQEGMNLRSMLGTKMKDIETIAKNKSGVTTLNLRVAAIMTTDNAV